LLWILPVKNWANPGFHSCRCRNQKASEQPLRRCDAKENQMSLLDPFGTGPTRLSLLTFHHPVSRVNRSITLNHNHHHQSPPSGPKHHLVLSMRAAEITNHFLVWSARLWGSVKNGTKKKCKENQLPVYFGRVLILNHTCFTVVFLAPMSTCSCSKWCRSKNGTWFTSNHNCAS